MDERFPRLALALAVVVAMLIAAAPALAGPAQENHKLESDGKAAEGLDEMVDAANQYAAPRVAPGGTVPAQAFVAARSQALTLPVVPAAWSELTTQRYWSDDPNYRDPVWSNSGGGAGNVTGRITALAADPADPSTVYAGAAGGGVWKTTDGGTTWAPLFDSQSSLAIGAIAINPADHSIWVGTGENNTAFENYTGTGVFRSSDGGASWTQVGGDALASKTIGAITFDGNGNAWIGTNYGLYRGSDSGSGSFANVLDAASAGGTPAPYGMSIVNSVVVQPHSDGKVIVANMAWRSGADYNGFYVSRDGGQSFTKAKLNGAINPKALGRSTLAYSADGKKLYALVEDTFLINKGTQSGNSVLMGVFVSPSGNAEGPWSQIADYRKLANSGSALRTFPANYGKGYQPGVQAWYNQFLQVDPADSDHVYVGLEEVFETRNGGSTWKTIAPYWNFGLPCFEQDPDSCPMTPHSDQHAVAVSGGRLWIGNDGGVYSRSLSAPMNTVAGWSNHNAGLRALQYYYAGAGHVDGGDAVWGGLQDNGTSLIRPDLDHIAPPFGGDGGDVIVDPNNGDHAVVEYTDLDMALTTNGGVDPNYSQPASFTEITPSCFPYTYSPRPDCDPQPRFIAPFTADTGDINHWVAGGRYVWDNQDKGWDTRFDTWQPVDDVGASNTVTAVAVNGSTDYVGWCSVAPSCYPPASSVPPGNPGSFSSGLRTNYGGVWHDIGADLPNRYVQGLTVDPADPAHVYAVFGGFTRRWIPNAGVGHVFESTDGGGTWTDISGNLPDAPGDDLVISHGKLVLATDVGVFVADQSTPSDWSRLGSNLPNSPTNDLAPGSDGSYVIAATHGRGLWKVAAP